MRCDAAACPRVAQLVGVHGLQVVIGLTGANGFPSIERHDLGPIHTGNGSSTHAVSPSYLISRESTGLYTPITARGKELEAPKKAPLLAAPGHPSSLVGCQEVRWVTGFPCTFVKCSRQKRRWKRNSLWVTSKSWWLSCLSATVVSRDIYEAPVLVQFLP